MNRIIWYPGLVAAYPILFLFFSNRRTYPMAYGELWVPLLIATPCTILIGWGIGRLRHQLDRGAIIASLLAILFFSYGRLNELQAITGPIGTAGILIGTLIVGSYYALTAGKNPIAFTRVATIASVALVLWQPTPYVFSRLTTPEEKGSDVTAVAASLKNRPDIYFILLDGYARADTLAQMYRFDNQPFVQSLRDRGFFVADHNTSNYNETIPTLVSMLNLNYVQALLPNMPSSATDRQPYDNLIKRSLVSTTLKQNGYTSIAYATGYPYTELTQSDIFLSPHGTLSEFHTLLLSTTPVPDLLRFFKSPTILETFRRRMDFVFDHLPDPANKHVPTFSFAHLVAPHPPFVVDENGNPTTDPRLIRYHDGDLWARNPVERELYQEYYPKQLAYVNHRVLQAVDEILRRSTQPPIIILMSDHGAGSEWSVNSLEQTNLQERYTNFFSIYLPGPGEPQPSDTITPVNVFRLIFSRYFGSDTQPLPDRRYFLPLRQPYSFTEVTDRIRP